MYRFHFIGQMFDCPPTGEVIDSPYEAIFQLFQFLNVSWLCCEGDIQVMLHIFLIIMIMTDPRKAFIQFLVTVMRLQLGYREISQKTSPHLQNRIKCRCTCFTYIWLDSVSKIFSVSNQSRISNGRIDVFDVTENWNWKLLMGIAREINVIVCPLAQMLKNISITAAERLSDGSLAYTFMNLHILVLRLPD